MRTIQWLPWAVVMGALAVAACGPSDDDPASEPGGGEGSDGEQEIETGRCNDHRPERQAFFGDLHVHTSYSLDAYTFGTRNNPAEAYAFAKGAALPVPGSTGLTSRLERPLDFSAVTDHAEQFAWRVTPVGAWARFREAAEQAYDRTAACRFTSFIGFEWSGIKSPGTWLHRNVVFKNAAVTSRPLGSNHYSTPEALWDRLDAECRKAGKGCDVIAIPHNSNRSGGLMFELGDGTTASYARMRKSMEPLAEVFQYKGNSECKRGVDSQDPLCEFAHTYTSGDCAAAPAGCRPGGFVRNALKRGLQLEQRLGVNPLKLGLIASTDTHQAMPGNVEEDTFRGHQGAVDTDPRDRLDPTQDFSKRNPGGLVGVWAEENSRPSLFAALKRRETFATSGPRIKVRFFGGWALPADLCSRPDLAKTGYSLGVPMGGDLPARPAGSGAPAFLVWAVKDLGTTTRPGVPLQHIQVIKGWLDPATGQTLERVFEVAGNKRNGASVDVTTCALSGPGEDSLCTVWRDPTFVPSQRAFYYARVLENPSCGSRAYDCNRLPAAERPASCTDGAVTLTTQDRVWTSPIWYQP